MWSHPSHALSFLFFHLFILKICTVPARDTYMSKEAQKARFIDSLESSSFPDYSKVLEGLGLIYPCIHSYTYPSIHCHQFVCSFTCSFPHSSAHPSIHLYTNIIRLKHHTVDTAGSLTIFPEHLITASTGPSSEEASSSWVRLGYFYNEMVNNTAVYSSTDGKDSRF